MKKALLPICLLALILCGCNLKRFEHMLTGTWKINHYIFATVDETAGFMDTTHVNFQLTINENNTYNRTWTSYSYKADSLILQDSVKIDSMYVIKLDTVRFIDTTITPYVESGRWDLLNSQEDIQLTSDSNLNNPTEYRILSLKKSTFNILNGNEEYDMTK